MKIQNIWPLLLVAIILLVAWFEVYIMPRIRAAIELKKQKKAHLLKYEEWYKKIIEASQDPIKETLNK